MKKVIVLGVAALFFGIGTTSDAAVTHMIINKSDHAIQTGTYYRGRVDMFKSCRPDTGTIQPGQSFISKAGGCLLEWVQIKDLVDNKTIRINVVNTSKNVLKEVGVVAGVTLIPLLFMASVGAGGALGIWASGPSSAFLPGVALGAAVGAMITIPALSAVGEAAKKKYYELVVYAFTSTVWEYDGVYLKPTSGVHIYEVSDFSQSN